MTPMIRVGDRVAFPPAYQPLNPTARTGKVTRVEQITETLAIATVLVDGPGAIRSFRANVKNLQKVQS